LAIFHFPELFPGSIPCFHLSVDDRVCGTNGVSFID